ncbi:MAG: phage major capsid protein [Clostridium sp.]
MAKVLKENKRDYLLTKAEELINSNQLESAEEIMQEIKKMDNAVNTRALEDNNKVTDISNRGVNIEDGKVFATMNNINSGGGSMAKVFLNQSEKLADRVSKDTNENDVLLNSDGALGEVIKGMVTGQWSNQEFKNIIGTTATGALIPQVLSAKIIDKARELSLFTSAGVPIVPMDSNNMTISRVKNNPTFKFKEEGKVGENTEFELDSIELKSKTAYGYAYVSLEAINSSKNLDSILHTVFAEAMASAIDKAFIYGQSTEGKKDIYAPSGIMNDTNINSIIAGEKVGYDDFIKAIAKVRKSNGEPTVYGINSDTEELLSLLKTSDGQYLEAPKSVTKLKQIVSNQLISDETNGNDAIVFDPNALLIGLQNNIQIKIIEDTKCIENGLIGFQIYSMLDCQATTPKNICKITGIK